MDQDVQEVGKQKDVNKKDMELCNKFEENICIKEEKVYLLSRKEREEVRAIHFRSR